MAVVMATGSQCLLSLETKTKLSGGGGEGKEPGESGLGFRGGNHAGATLRGTGEMGKSDACPGKAPANVVGVSHCLS